MGINLIKKAYTNEKSLYTLLFLCGFFGLSNNITNIILNSIGVNFYLLEIFLVPILCQRKIRDYINVKLTLTFVFLMLFCAISLGIGCITTGDLAGVITCGRSMLYMLLVSYYLPRMLKSDNNANMFFALSLGALCGDLVFIVLNIGVLYSMGFIHINILAITFCVIIPFITRKKSCILLGMGLSTIAALFSGYRINMLVLLLSVLVGGLYYIKASKIITKIIGIMVYVLLAYIILNNYMAIMESLADVLHLPQQTVYRLIERTEGIVTGDLSNSDEGRIRQYQEILPKVMNQFLPVGPIGKTKGATAFGLYTDVPITYLIDMFGSVFAIVLCVYVFLKALRVGVMMLIRKNNPQMKVLSVLCFPVIFCLFVINGTIFSFTNISIMVAIPLGYLVRERIHK